MTLGARPRRLRSLLPARRRALGRLAIAAALAAFAFVLLTLAVPTGEAQAAASLRRPTVLQLQLPPTVRLGEHPLAQVRLTSGGVPVFGELISIHLGTRVSAQVTTGPDGTASADIVRDLPAGQHLFVATFAGTKTFISSSSPEVTFTVSPIQLTIATVPAMPNTSLIRVGTGAALKTDASGTVKVMMTDVGMVALTLALPADGPIRRLRLDRWDDGSTDRVRTIRIPDTLQLTIALQIFYPVQFAFSASDGEAIVPTDVPTMGISDSTGAVRTLAGPVTYWLQANAITRLTTGLDSAPAEYRIASVTVDGAEVVNRGQQRFVFDAAKTVDVQLLVFKLDIQGKDALLRTSSGSTARITSGAGVTQVVELDARGHASLRLPRGDYHIVLRSGLGIPLSTPVAFSRDQGVDVLFVSLVDMALVIGAGLVSVFGLIAVGRPQLLRRRSGAHPSVPQPHDGAGTGDPGSPALTWPDPSTPRELPRREQRPKSGP